jgi:hypothetical protein
VTTALKALAIVLSGLTVIAGLGPCDDGGTPEAAAQASPTSPACAARASSRCMVDIHYAEWAADVGVASEDVYF